MPSERGIDIRNAKSLIGMPVMLDGKRMGRVLNIGMTPDLRGMTGVFVDCGLRGNRFVPIGQVRLIGEVAVFVNDWGRRARAEGTHRMHRALSTDGRRLGAISGALIDEENRSIEALELSKGYIDDLIGGRQYVRHYTVGADREVVVSDETQRARVPEKGGNTP